MPWPLLKDLAGDFHGWYNAERVLVDDDATREAAAWRFALATRQVLQNGICPAGRIATGEHVNMGNVTSVSGKSRQGTARRGAPR